ncbi:TadE family protein [Phytoactinopolyspora mesophila]|uniref:Pilus assembly protein n=1 Tax=Phytoactinopolyspora mesophila TaxID=2650750 RepID=A0A7K3MAB9_9ACTN|nr:pilus assembly protein [Phytoactinopolyspora mesophila]
MSTARRKRNERGSVALESVIVWPLVLAALFAIIQGGLWFHARNVALGAAQEGARVASAESRGDGAARASAFISNAGGPKIMSSWSTSQSSTASVVTVTVTGRAPSVLPGVSGPKVTQSSTAPLREWTTR